MKGEACALRGGSAHEAEAPREDELQLLNTADMCHRCGMCHHPRPCWLAVLPHTLGTSPPALCCRGCASPPHSSSRQAGEAVPGTLPAPQRAMPISRRH